MTWRFAGANFDQMHMNTNLEWARDHPDTEVVGVDPEPEPAAVLRHRVLEGVDLALAERRCGLEHHRGARAALGMAAAPALC